MARGGARTKRLRSYHIVAAEIQDQRPPYLKTQALNVYECWVNCKLFVLM